MWRRRVDGVARASVVHSAADPASDRDRMLRSRLDSLATFVATFSPRSCPFSANAPVTRRHVATSPCFRSSTLCTTMTCRRDPTDRVQGRAGSIPVVPTSRFNSRPHDKGPFDVCACRIAEERQWRVHFVGAAPLASIVAGVQELRGLSWSCVEFSREAVEIAIMTRATRQTPRGYILPVRNEPSSSVTAFRPGHPGLHPRKDHRASSARMRDMRYRQANASA